MAFLFFWILGMSFGVVVLELWQQHRASRASARQPMFSLPPEVADESSPSIEVTELAPSLIERASSSESIEDDLEITQPIARSELPSGLRHGRLSRPRASGPGRRFGTSPEDDFRETSPRPPFVMPLSPLKDLVSPGAQAENTGS